MTPQQLKKAGGSKEVSASKDVSISKEVIEKLPEPDERATIFSFSPQMKKNALSREASAEGADFSQGSRETLQQSPGSSVERMQLNEPYESERKRLSDQILGSIEKEVYLLKRQADHLAPRHLQEISRNSDQGKE